MTDRHPLEGQVVLLGAARASVTLEHLSKLLARAQPALRQRRESYDRQYERLEGSDGVVYYLAETGHWADVGASLGFADREVDAVRRTHTAQFRRDGRRLGRREEFESALELRDAVALEATDGEENESEVGR
jgi:hypothetical protein